MHLPNSIAELSDAERTEVAERKATCPFIASAVSDKHLPVRNDAGDPLASIDDVRRLGNTGGGDLGEVLTLRRLTGAPSRPTRDNLKRICRHLCSLVMSD